MSRNAESKFAAVPRAEISRSRFDMSKRLLTTMNAGKLIPIYCKDVLPGDTVTMDTASLVRMSTPIFPVMDNCFMDIYYFFVPNRLLWDHWKQFMGENTESAWTPSVEYTVPYVRAPMQGWQKGSVADYFGLPTGQRGCAVDAMPFRAYVKIWNEFFRDQNYMEPAYCHTGDSSTQAPTANPNDPWDGLLNAHVGCSLLPVAKPHDYFTSVLPAPQKGEPVRIPAFSGAIPVYTSEDFHDQGMAPLAWSLSASRDSVLGIGVGGDSFLGDSQVSDVTPDNVLYPLNLWADTTGVYSSDLVGTITELRQAFQIQKLLEADARGGTRYTELLNAHFGVTSPDARLQRPEYLGGKRIPINIDQVLQTSATNEVSPQGNTAAFSLTTDVDSSFTKSFVEHGWIIGVACVRTDHTYQQGIEKMWSRRNRFDYYWPELANISEQPVYFKEIVASTPTNSLEVLDGVFGYQEAWAEYRYSPSQVTGAFRSQYAQSLDAWHYADYFDIDNMNIDLVADRDFMMETPINIDRTLAVSSEVEDQFLCNFYFKSTWTRPMPLFSVPGLADHH